MKRRKVITIIILLAFKFSAFGQNLVLSKIPARGTSLIDFIPMGYDTLQVVSGDLNKDAVNDVVLAIRHRAEDSLDMDEAPKRILVVLLKQNNGYDLVGKSDNVVKCRQCGGAFGDPLADISITKGVLVISHYGGSSWRWSEDRKFRYQNQAVYLIGSTSDYYWNVSDCDGEGVGEAGRRYRDVNWVTGDEEIIERDENCKLKKQEKHKLKKQALVKLESFKYEE